MGASGAETGAQGVAVDASGNVYVAGWTSGGLDGNALAGTYDFFLTKYDSIGTKVYTKLMGAAAASTSAYGVAVDAAGNVFVTGSTTGELDGNAPTGVSTLFIAKYDSNGTRQ